jgi:fibronectin-binding autotransporter adhesin
MKTTILYPSSSRRSYLICACYVLAVFFGAADYASAQTTRTWTNSTNTQYNNFNNWDPTGTWSNSDTLRFNGTVGGALNLFYQGGQNTGVLLDFTAAQTGAVSISLSNEATQSRNFRLGNTNNTVAISIASGAGKVTLNGQSETFRMLPIFGPTTDPGSAPTIFIDNAGTLEFGTFTTLQRAQSARNVDLVLRGGGQTTILGRVNEFGTFGGIRVQSNSVLTLSGEWVANTRLMVDEGRADFTSAAAIGTNSAWNSIRVGNNVTSGQLRYTGSGDVEVGRRIQIGNGAAGAQTGSAVIESESATGRLVFTNAIFNADGADALGSGNANTAAARTLTLGGSSALSNAITGSIVDNSTNGGTIGVIKEGAGRWVLSGSNSHTGGTTVSAGTLVLGHANALSSGAVTVNGGTLDLNGLSVTANQLRGSGGTIALGGGALTANNTSTTTNASVISGTGSLTKAGSGILVLAGNSTYTGDTFLEGGNIQLGLANALSTASVLLFSANANNRRLQMQGLNQTLGGVDSTAATGGILIIEAASDNVSDAPATLTLDVATGQSHNFSGIVRNAAGTAVNSALSLIKNGSGTQVLSGGTGQVTYSGNTTINAGVLEFAGTNSVANASAITLGGGTLRFSGGGTRSATISGSGNLEKTGANTLTLSGNNSFSGTTTVSAGVLEFSTANSVNNNSAITLVTNSTVRFSGGGTRSNTIAGSGNFEKTGANTLTLSGNNTYSGTTTVSAGSLIINGDQSGATGILTVSTNATLGGSGMIGGATTINGNLQPGNSPGILTFSSGLTLTGTAVTTMEINGLARGTDYDVINVVGGLLTYDGRLTLSLSGPVYGIGIYSFDLFDFVSQTGAFDVVELLGSYSGSLTNNGLGVWGLSSGNDTWSFSQADGVLSLNVVPEPSTYALLVLSAAGLAAHVVRRRRRSAR